MGYRNDAFYNLPQSERDIPRSNAKFMYPSNQIRFLAAQEALDRRGGTSPTGTEIPGANQYIVKRGYIRGLGQPGIDDTFTTMKCGFQFNPQQIVQTVIMREDMYLPLLQDPSQFTQPLGSSVNFNFDLVFDRSHEVASGTTIESEGQYGAFNMESPDYTKDARDIGVLADMQVLYAIVGQGFSKELLDFQAKRLEQAGIRAANTDGTGTAVSIDDIKKTVNDSNLGNAAFLIPNPVRVVFSSLFMVDGFVTGTSVDFLKFSNNMVPLQVKVGVSMNAVYIGFAREKTFLTYQLEQTGAVLKQEEAVAAEEKRELTTLALEDMKYFSYGTYVNNGYASAIEENPSIADSSWQLATSSNSSTETPVYRWAFKRSGLPNDWTFSIALGFADFAQDGLTDLIKGAQPIKISYSWWFYVYGPFNTKAEAQTFASRKVSDASKMLGSYKGNFNSGDLDPDKFTFKRWSDSPANGATRSATYSESEALAYSTKYFTTQFDVRVDVTGAQGGNPSALGSKWTAVYGQDSAYGKVTIPWTPTGGSAVRER